MRLIRGGEKRGRGYGGDDDDDVGLNVLGCRLTY